jgi:hypothetical protein
VGLGDFKRGIDAFKAGMEPGFTPPGMWGDMEKFGRFEGAGAVAAELELPECQVAISAEEHPEVENFEFELIGPDGQPIEVRRYSSKSFEGEGLKNLHRIATAKLQVPGHHSFRVKSPDPEEQLLIVVGEELTAGKSLKDFGEEMIPGRKLWKRLRGGD